MPIVVDDQLELPGDLLRDPNLIRLLSWPAVYLYLFVFFFGLV